MMRCARRTRRYGERQEGTLAWKARRLIAFKTASLPLPASVLAERSCRYIVTILQYRGGRTAALKGSGSFAAAKNRRAVVLT